MKNIAMLLGLLVLLGCTVNEPVDTTPSRPVSVATVSSTPQAYAPYVLPRSSAQVAQDLTDQYNTVVVNCGANNMPAFQCSGVDIRGTGSLNGYHSWEPSETAIRVGGTSFTFLRADYKVKRLAMSYVHGFVFYPKLKRPAGKAVIEVLCFFPIDGISDNRPEGGCGATPGRPMSDLCHRVGVETGPQWAEHYNTYGAHSLGGIGGCAMDTRDYANTHAGPNFAAGIEGGKLISPKPFNKPNDLKHKTWTTENIAALPIQAFIYLTAEGLVLAQKDQRRFYEETGELVPVIKVVLPQTLEEDASFTFNGADQFPACTAGMKF